jgi:hypothetical protein
MKKNLMIVALILIAGVTNGQTFPKGNLVGFHAGTVDLDPDVSLNQWKKFAIDTFFPAFNKEFEGEIAMYLADGERGKFENYVGWFMVFKTIEVRNKYIPEPGKRTELYESKWEKVQPIFDELGKMGSWSEEHYTDWVIR